MPQNAIGFNNLLHKELYFIAFDLILIVQFGSNNHRNGDTRASKLFPILTSGC
jgi:hypothetical protein